MNAVAEKSNRPGTFPMDALPAPLSALCAARPEMVVAALAVVAGAIGPSAQIRRTSTQETFSANIFSIIRAEGGRPEWLASLLAPINEYQQHLLAGASWEAEEGELSALEAGIESNRRHFFRNDRFPDPAHMRYFDHRLRQVGLRKRRIFHSENPAPGTILSLFQQNPEQCMFLTWLDPRSFRDHCEFWDTAKGQKEGELIVRALSGGTFTQSRDDDISVLTQPSLNGIAVCDDGCLKRLIDAESELLRKAGLVLVVDGGAHAEMATLPSNREASYGCWRHLVRRLLDERFGLAPRVYSLSDGAEDALVAAHAAEFHGLWEKHGVPPHLAVELCLQIMLVLHVCQERPADVIPDATALSAIQISRWALEENYQVIQALRDEDMIESGRAASMAMLEKIRRKGPVSRRDLFRSYDRQKRSPLVTILEELIGSGMVVEDPQGLLSVAAADEQATQIFASEIAHCHTANTATP